MTNFLINFVQCDDGYTLSKDSRSCVKCNIKNCMQCSSNGKSCAQCNFGYGYDKKAKVCTPCKVSNCEDCSKDITKCIQCGYDYKNQNAYGLVNGKCAPCADPNAGSCANNKVTSCNPGYYVDKASNSCKPCTKPCVNCASATNCYFCDIGYNLQASNGKCVPLMA